MGDSTTEALDDDDLDDSCSFAISSLSLSCSVIPIPPLPLPILSPGRPGAARDGLGIDLDISSPIGFFRLMEDLGPPKEDKLPTPSEEPVGVVAVDKGERDEMDLGGAAKRELLTGGTSSAIVVDIVVVVDAYGVR